jgi:hypothetical protein
MIPNRPTINFANTTIELFDPNLTTDYLNTITFSDPSSVQTSSSSNDDENFKMMGGGGGGGGGRGGRGEGDCGGGYVLPPAQLQLPTLKRHHTESEIGDLPTSSFSLRIRQPSVDIVNECLIEEYSTARGRTPRIAHENALHLAEISPKYDVELICNKHILKGPHFPTMKKSLSWSGVIEKVKKYNDTSPVAKI